MAAGSAVRIANSGAAEGTTKGLEVRNGEPFFDKRFPKHTDFWFNISVFKFKNVVTSMPRMDFKKLKVYRFKVNFKLSELFNVHHSWNSVQAR